MMEGTQVRCLSDIADLQRACQTASLRFSAETNKFLVYQTLHKLGPSAAQKLVSKLVDDGFIQWDEDEDFEVQSILDHADEEGKRYYLIKWQGWSHFHNSWEPADNLLCPTMVSDYLASCKRNNAKPQVKRSLPVLTESAQISKRRKVDEIFHKLWYSPMSAEMSPLKLLTLHNSHLQTKKKQVLHKGLITSHDRCMRPKFATVAPNYTSTKKKLYREKKADIQAALKDWERKLNSINTDPAPILVENEVDLEGPPENFVYINDYRAGEGIEIPQDPIIGCECENCVEEKKSCCGAACGSEFAYYRWKRLRVPRGTPIYECNKRCKCGPDCPNRVVQQGRKIKVCIFRTSNSRGWGVKTLQKIKRGSFVMEYVGEVITNEEAERRGKIYDAECRTYLFDLDYNDGDCPFTVDAGYYGNVSHFVNHSCEPNLVVYGVWINTLDPRLPRICLFADRDIDKGEELTFDYMMTGDTTQQGMGSLGFSLQKSPSLGSPDVANGLDSPAQDEPEPSEGSPQDVSMDHLLMPREAGAHFSGLRTPVGSPVKPQHTASAAEGNISLSPSKGKQTEGNISLSPSKGKQMEGNISLSPSKGKQAEGNRSLSPSKGKQAEGNRSLSPSKGKQAEGNRSLSPSKGKQAEGNRSLSPSKGSQAEGNRSLSPSKEKQAEDNHDENVPTQAKIKYRMICQCGSAKCRKYLF